MSRTPASRLALAGVSLLALGVASASDAPVRVDVVSDDGQRIVLSYAFDAFRSDTVAIQGAEHLVLRIPGEPVRLEAGAPALPHVNRSVAIPDTARMELRVLESSHYETFARVAPSKGNLSRAIDPRDVPYAFGETYRIDAFFPGPLATLGAPYVLRDHRGIVVQVNPFQYNPVTRVLRVYTSMTLEVASVGTDDVNVLDRSRRAARPSRAFERIYRSQFLNHGAGRYDPIDEQGSMRILCHDAWLDEVAPLAAHKNSMGIPTTVVPISSVGTTASAIKSWLQAAYDSSDLAFVLLVGDVAQIGSPSSSGGASDPSYAKLAGNDAYPDVLVGRFSANSAAEVETQVRRTIEYETGPATAQPWFARGTGIASAEGAGIGDEGQSDIAHESEIREWLLGAGYTEVDEIYDPGASASAVTTALAAGRGIVNYTGHGWSGGWSTTGFSTSSVNALSNAGMLPFIVSVACNNGEFENYTTCFAEAWMRATDDDDPSGAVAIYASSISQSWAPPMEAQDEINLLLADPTEPYHTFGALCFAGSSSMMDAYGAAGVEMFDTWILFGDPSLRVAGAAEPAHGLRVVPDRGVVAEGPAGGLFAPDEEIYTIENLDDHPLEWQARVAEPWIDVVPEGGSLPAHGSAEVRVRFDPRARNLDHGHYVATLELLNLTDHDGDTTRTVSLTVGVPLLRERWSLDAFPAGWTLAGKWGYGHPLGLGGDSMGNPDPAAAASGDNVFGVAMLGDYSVGSGGPYWLTSAPVDLADAQGTTLEFQRWLNTEALPLSEARVQVSANGIDWHDVWTNTAGVADGAWSPEAFDVSSIADGATGARVRWGYGVYEGATPCSGWNLDDIEIWAAPDSTARIELTVGRDELAWTSIAGAVEYDVVRGDLGALRAGGGDFTAAVTGCVAGRVDGPSAPFADEPAAGEGIWLLVRGRSTTGPLTWQALFDSQVGVRDDEVELAPNTCP